MAAAGKPQVLKQYNTSMIQRLIMEKGPITKPELSHLTNLSLPTVNKIVDELVTEKIVMEDMIQTGAGAGRKAMAYVVNGNYGTFVTLYYLDEKWIGCVSNILGEVLFKAEYYINSDHKKEELEFLTAAVDDLMVNAERVKAIGVGIPGIVMNDEKIAAIPQLPEFEGINLKKLFQEKYQLPVFIENDVKLMTVGYYSCRMKNLNNMVFLYIGNGIGGGTIINGQLYKGNTCFAGEFGYIPSGQEETEEEFPGGSLEKRLTSLKKEMKKPDQREKAKSQFCTEIGRALVSCAAMINPEAVVLYCKELDKEALQMISYEIKKFLPQHSIPQIYLTANNNYGILGLIHMCQEGINPKMQLLDTLEK